MVALTYAVLALAALSAASGGDIYEFCTQTIFGSTDGPAVPLPDKYIAPGVRTANFIIPKVCLPASQIGFTVIACDEDAGVYIEVINDHFIRIIRGGNLEGTAMVSIIVNCDLI